MEELPLEPDLIEVLASDTRRAILGNLQERRMTVTELSQELDLRKATVHEHLKKLVNTGLIEREEDERIWVYYRLTPRAKRLLNPKRTRFYLAIAVTALAGVIALAALAIFLSSSPPAMDDGLEAQPGPSTSAYLADAENVRLEIETDADTTHAYLIPQQHVSNVQHGDASTQGIPLNTHQATLDEPGPPGALDERSTTPSQTVFTTEGPIPPGTYHLFLRGAQDDNRDAMPTVHATHLEAHTSHDTWWRGISPDLVITLDAPQTGTLHLEPRTHDAPMLKTPIDTDQTRISATRLDDLPPGSYTITLETTRDERHPLTTLQIKDPTLHVTPQRIPTGEPTPANVTLQGAHEPLKAPLTITGEPLPSPIEGTTHEPATLTPQHAGEIHVSVGRLATATIQAQPTFHVALAYTTDGEHTLNLSHANDTPATDHAIRLNERSLGFTDEQGALHTDPLPQGAHELTLQTPQGETATATLQVNDTTITPQTPHLTVDTRTLKAHPAPLIEVRLEEANGHPATGTVSIHTERHTQHIPFDVEPNGMWSNQARILPGPDEDTYRVTVERFQQTHVTFEDHTDESNGNDPSQGANRLEHTANVPTGPTAVGDQDASSMPEAADGPAERASPSLEHVFPQTAEDDNAPIPWPTSAMILGILGTVLMLGVTNQREGPKPPTLLHLER